MDILLAIINILFNPFSFFIFISYSSKKHSYFFSNAGTNVSKLKLIPYLVFSSIYLTIILALTYFSSFYIDFNFWEAFTPKNLYVSATTWLITALTLRRYFKGMEGNIMGFIFFPLLALSMITLTILSFFDILQVILHLDAPTVKINFWLRILIHAFCPFYILLYLNSKEQKKEESNDAITILLSCLILQFIFFSVNWLVTYLFGTPLTFSKFFGEDQSITYYIPMIGGFLLFILFFASKIIGDKKSKQYKLEEIIQYTIFLNFGLVVLEFINYFNLMSSFF